MKDGILHYLPSLLKFLKYNTGKLMIFYIMNTSRLIQTHVNKLWGSLYLFKFEPTNNAKSYTLLITKAFIKSVFFFFFF